MPVAVPLPITPAPLLTGAAAPALLAPELGEMFSGAVAALAAYACNVSGLFAALFHIPHVSSGSWMRTIAKRGVLNNVRVDDSHHAALAVLRLRAVEPDGVCVSDRNGVCQTAVILRRHEAGPECVRCCSGGSALSRCSHLRDAWLVER
jgi:hypothetical protein